MLWLDPVPPTCHAYGCELAASSRLMSSQEKNLEESNPQLPASVSQLFWEYEAGAVSWDAHRDFIVERVLARGDWDALRWIRARAGDEVLRDILTGTRGRSLSRAQLRFWQLLLDLPEEQVTAWLGTKSREIWHRRSA